MGSLVLLFAGALSAAQTEPAETISVRLQKEQELVYRGYYTETMEQPGTRTSRTWDLLHCILIRNTGARGVDAAFLTIQKARPQPGMSTESVALLDEATIEPSGKIMFRPRPNVPPRVPFNGPPNVETSVFVEMPRTGFVGGNSWDVTAENQLPQSWKIDHVESYPGGRCAVLIGEQAAPEWKYKAGSAWFRQDKVWIDLNAGFAIKIERTTCRREEIDIGQALFTGTTVCVLDNNVPTPCPAGLFRDRNLAVRQVSMLKDELTELQKPRGAPDLQGYDLLLKRIDLQLGSLAETPYREALATLRRQVEAAKKGERPPVPLVIESHKPVVNGVELGQAAADFVATDIFTGKQVRLSRLQGRPTMLLFFKPSSATARQLLQYAQSTAAQYNGQAWVFVLATEGSAETILPLRNELHLTIGIHTGQDGHRALGGDTTPRIVILDKSGMIRFIVAGWGGEYPDLLDKALKETIQLSP
jgi:hypothetical protein